MSKSLLPMNRTAGVPARSHQEPARRGRNRRVRDRASGCARGRARSVRSRAQGAHEVRGGLSLTALLASACLVLADAEVGKPAPDFTGKDINGKTHRLADFKGKIVVLEACNLDCPFCANHFKTGAMQELQAYATSKGAIWLVVNSVHAGHPSYRKPGAAKKEFAAQKMKATAWIDDSDGKIGKAYGLKTTPHMVVIDPRGVVAYKGAIDNRPSDEGDPRTARNYVREAIDSLLAGKNVAVAKTQPYGCGVKYAD